MPELFGAIAPARIADRDVTAETSHQLPRCLDGRELGTGYDPYWVLQGYTLVAKSAKVHPTARLGFGSYVGPNGTIETDVVVGALVRMGRPYQPRPKAQAHARALPCVTLTH